MKPTLKALKISDTHLEKKLQYYSTKISYTKLLLFKPLQLKILPFLYNLTISTQKYHLFTKNHQTTYIVIT